MSGGFAGPATLALRRRQILVWALYDFAGSVYPAVISATVFSVYFASVIVGNERGGGDLWWGRVLSVSMLFVALSSPFLGSVADRAGVRKPLLVLYTGLCVGSVALFPLLEPGKILPAFLLAVSANVGFEGALVFYNAYLPDIAPPDRRGWVSGLGYGFGYAGSAVGLLIALPLVQAGRYDLTWLSVAAFFALFSLPAILGLPGGRPGTRSVLAAARDGIVGFRRIAADAWGDRRLRRFLLAYFVYIDGINTVVYFSGIFATTTLGFDRRELILLYLLVQVSALAGAFALARPTDRWGPKRVVAFTLLFWIAVACSAYFITTKRAYFAVALVAGGGLGVVQAASRALLASLIPEGKEAELFGFYAFCGKSSSVLGPLVFGGLSYALGGNQRIAILSVAAFFVVGLVLLAGVNDGRRALPAGGTG